jgi:hypothetical protein
MISNEGFISKDARVPVDLSTVESPAEYVDAFRASYDVVSNPRQWVRYLDDLRTEHNAGTLALGLQNWVLQELVPRPPDATPHRLRTVRRYERFVPQCNVAYLTLLHQHARGIRIIIKTGDTPDAEYSYALDAKERGSLTMRPSNEEVDAVYSQFDYFLKTYRLPSELAYRPPVTRLE